MSEADVDGRAADIVAGLMARLSDGGIVWQVLTARLAQIADRNAPGWDAGEMATEALFVVRQALGIAEER